MVYKQLHFNLKYVSIVATTTSAKVAHHFTTLSGEEDEDYQINKSLRRITETL